MYKLIKSKILGNAEKSATTSYNPNYRSTMGYNNATNTITIKVEKLIREDLTREQDVAISYETVDEKSFTKADFIQTKDLMAWCVDFDVTTEKILAPFNVYAYTSTLASGSTYHYGLWNQISMRYSQDLMQLFTVDSFYKNVSDFSLSTLQFHVVTDEETTSKTVLTNTDVQEMTQPEKHNFIVQQINTLVFYEIFDESDNLVSSIVNYSPYPQILSPGVVTLPARSLYGNRYRASLPNAAQYKVKVLFHNDLLDKTISAKFDVVSINSIASKTRVDSGIKDTELQSYSGGPFNTVDIHGNARFAGSETIKLTLNLESGDYTKLKLSVGDFHSYSELWIDIV